MLVALVLAAVVVTTVYYREGVRGPLHSTRSAVLAASGPIAKAGTALLSPLRAIGGFAGSLGASAREVAALRQQNTELRDRLTALEEARQENVRLRGLVAISQAQDVPTVGARVIEWPSSSWDQAVVLDRGTADKVRVGMPVVAGEGLVGQVVDVTAHDCRVRLISDQRSGVAAIVQRTRAAGIVRGSVKGELSLDFLEGAKSPKKGDVVITSGVGGIYPKGLVIGDVSAVVATRGALFPSVTVVSRVAVGDVEEVLIMLTPASAGDAGAGE